LDTKPTELLEFQQLIEQPGWMGFEDPEVDLNLSEFEDLPEEDSSSLETSSSLLDDPAIAVAIKKINDLTSSLNRTRLARLRTMHLLPIDTMIRVSYFPLQYRIR
jgi:hypothetical protein